MIDEIVKWIREKVKEAGAKGVVFGVSGGVDSAVAAALCKKAFPDNCLGLFLPCFSLGQDLKHAEEIKDAFKIQFKIIDLTATFLAHYQKLEGKSYSNERSLAIVNLKPRLRMSSLYYFANKLNYLVVGTGNRSEAVMGYFTKYGDGGVDILPLGNLLKTQVRQLAKDLKVPQDIITKPPSAGLWEGQTDENEMGITYEELDQIIIAMDQNKLEGLNKKLVDKVKKAQAASEHKRCAPEIFTS